ncbi:winged helix-turn-helix domain-containing protein [Pedobacter antarcticus]|uniref:winged helix-turn-helix domain-containing protein n=1 Tax=Pedobacter antarcticus TaxID=34086 RepID=UPI00088C9F9C|nr:winged helix-turn-helix domain-containing protein [Pedobacter antarcticus]SDL84026.1 Transcriptional regulatory protein, C terminal [Pedobacter antarcticus]
MQKLRSASVNETNKREEILLQLWKSDDYFSGRSLDVFVSRLRKYLSADDQISLSTIRGIGFEFKY